MILALQNTVPDADAAAVGYPVRVADGAKPKVLSSSSIAETAVGLR